MQIYSDIRSFSPPPGARTAVTLGNYDGFHRGHQAVLRDLVEWCRNHDALSVLVTFEPHPQQFFGRVEGPFRITPFAIKKRMAEAMGVDVLIAHTFDQDFSEVQAERFVEDYLVRHLHPRLVVVGPDARFGHNREGTPDHLRRLGRVHGFELRIPDEYYALDRPVHSRAIREDLKAGRTLIAARKMGHPYYLVGPVVEGDRRGRILGFKTANIHVDQDVLIPPGVYAARIILDAHSTPARHEGIMYYGRKLTFSEDQPILEAHLFGFEGNLYGQELVVEVWDRLRGEERFEGQDELREQIRRDVQRAEQVLAGITMTFDPFLPLEEVP